MRRSRTPTAKKDVEKAFEMANAIQEKDETNVERLLDDAIQCKCAIDTYCGTRGMSLYNLLIEHLPERDDIFLKIMKCGGRKSIYQADSNRYTPLAKAIELHSVKYTKLLLAQKADPNNTATWSGYTALEQAAFIGDPSIVKTLLEHGANVNHYQHLGDFRHAKLRVLFFALDSKNTEDNILKTFVALCEKKARLGVRSTVGDSVLHAAVRRGNLSVTRHLLGKLDINTLSMYGLPPIAGVSDLCKCYQPDWDALDSTIFDTAEEYGLGTKLYKQHPCKHIQLARMLLRNGAQVNCEKPTQYAGVPLCAAVCNRALPIVQLFVDEGAEILLKSPGYSAVNAVDSYSDTACRAIVKYLLMIAIGKYSKDDELVSRTGYEALLFNLNSTHNLPIDRKSIMDKLMEYNPNIKFWLREDCKRVVLQICIQKKNLIDLVKLLKCGLSPNQDNRKKNSLLLLICRGRYVPRAGFKQNLRLIQALLYYGADTGKALYSYFETFGSATEDIMDTAKMFVYCGLDMNHHEWLVEKLHPGVPLGGVDLRQWLIEYVLGPAPLLFLCRRLIRDLCKPYCIRNVNELPLPGPLKRMILLEDLLDPDLLDIIRNA